MADYYLKSVATYLKGIATLPAHMQDGVRAYIETGRPGGSFMTAVFANDMKNAFMRADAVNQRAMEAWVRFLYWYAPVACQGSYEKVEAWTKRHGLLGYETTPGESNADQEN